MAQHLIRVGFKYELFEYEFREKFMLLWSSLPLAAACFAQWTFEQWIRPTVTIRGGRPLLTTERIKQICVVISYYFEIAY
jgi:hypothetical protein